MKRIIAHLDMDAFFASVEEQKRPHLLGRPIVVGSEIIDGIGRGVVSTANYRAREYGIKSAMPITMAWRLSQEAKNQGKEEVIFLPVDFNLYHKISFQVFEIIKKYSNKVEQASVDEFYFDLSFADTFLEAKIICSKIKAEIKSKAGVTCSVGIGPNKLISKICAGIKKPDGLLVIEPKNVQDFLNPLDIRELSGIGPKTAQVFYKKNIKTIKDLNTFSLLELKELLGKQGEKIYSKVRGIDNDSITECREVKSIGQQVTLNVNSLDIMLIGDLFNKLCDSVFEKFVVGKFTMFKVITITVRFADFKTQTSAKSIKLGIGKNQKKLFKIEALKLLLPFLDTQKNPHQKLIRLIGIRIEKIVL